MAERGTARDPASDTARAARPGRVQSVERAVALLEAVAAAPAEGAGVAQLAEACGLNRATAWRLLATLEDQGLVDRDPAANRYSMGFGVARLAASAGVGGFVRRAHPVLVRLSERTGETVDLAVVRRLGLTYVDEVSPPSVLGANWLGRHVPLHATSSGKALLAWLPEEEADALLEGPLPRYTETTVTGRRALRAELEETRRRGYGVCVGELEGRLYGVSAPVLDVAHRPVAVVSVWGASDRVTRARFPELGALAVESAAELRRLRYVGRPS